MRLKAIVITLVGLVLALFRPLGRSVIRHLILPVYGVIYGLRRRMGNFYRPAKNRVMFLLTNRYAVHVVVIGVACVAGTVNFGLGKVRAESDSFGQRSILYSIVTNQELEVIEEYATFGTASDYIAVSSYGDDGLRAPIGGSVAIDPTTSMPGLSQSGLALSPITTAEPLATPAAPRTEIEKYVVDTGDTLSTISQHFGISLNTLLWANNLTVRSVIKPGMELTILPVTGVQHAVKNGETLSAIAKKYGVGTDVILTANNLESANALKIGQSLLVPGGQVIAPAPSSRPVAVRDIFTTAPVGSGGSTITNPGAKMVWPTDLRYIVRGLSYVHTGVDIDCNGRANGTSTNDNYAAMDGIVQFSGSKSGYGYAVEIDHGNGLVTRYGHFHTLYVSKGAVVTAGTPLGRCGSTGNSTGTHLHFEVIANGSFKNPANYLGY
ncbi:MAG: LysM peptidoglycan-binding domain-containing protein [Patescibacteria group bacterium]